MHMPIPKSHCLLGKPLKYCLRDCFWAAYFRKCSSDVAPLSMSHVEQIRIIPPPINGLKGKDKDININILLPVIIQI